MKKFECLDCHQIFEADENNWIECPHCKSDNFREASLGSSIRKHTSIGKQSKESNAPRFTKKNYIGMGILGGFIAIGLTILYFRGRPDTPDIVVEDTTSVTTINTDTAINIRVINTDYKERQPPMLYMVPKVPVFDGETGTYSCNIKVDFPPEEPFKFVIMGVHDNIVAESPDGKFTNVPYSTDQGGSYHVFLMSKDGKKTLSDTAPINGFIKQAIPPKRMQVAEIQKLLDKRDTSLMGLGESDYLSPELKLEFVGLSKTTDDIPTILFEVMEKLDYGTWKSVTVTKLQYDDMNRINKITFKIVE